MWNNNERTGADGSGAGNGNGNGKDQDNTFAKTTGLVVFSGIAMSIINAINPFNKPDLKMSCSELINPLTESTQPQPQVFPQCQPCLTPSPEPIIKKPNNCIEQNVEESSPKVIEIVRGDTLWGLSTTYGVSIEAMKEANGLTGDTIYAGKKLIIP